MSNSPEQLDQLFENAYLEAMEVKQKYTSKDEELHLQDLSSRYLIKDKIGEGAVKIVYHAYDKVIQRDVALAKIKANNSERVKDLLSEARLASKLEHPNIAPIYDMGVDQDGLAFFVMKLYEGRSLDEELKFQAQQLQEIGTKVTWVIDCISKVCDALAFAHSKGVLHLDIKPSNIRIDDYGEVLLCDWGISNMILSFEEEQPETDTFIQQGVVSRGTLVGEIRGTPGYMAPEQISKSHPCTETTDVFGLGALLLDMLTGSPIPKNDTENLPNELIAISSKAMSDSNAERYQNIQAFKDDLDKYQSGQVTLAENASYFNRTLKWCQRHKTMLGIIALNSFLVAVAIIFYIQSIQEKNIQLKNSNNQLVFEKLKKEEDKLRLAEQYYNQGITAYHNTVSKFDFDQGVLGLAKEMMVRSTQLNPLNQEAWGKLGNIRVINGEYKIAQFDYQKANENYATHLQLLNQHLPNLIDPNLNQLDQKLKFIGDFNLTKDRRLRNHMIFKEIHTFHSFDELLQFSIGATAIVNNLEKVDFTFDPQKMILNISNNRIRTLYPLKTLPIKRLMARNTIVPSSELYNIRRIPLTHLDISYSNIKNLGHFTNIGINYLSLEGNPVKDISLIKNTNVDHINIAFTPADLSPLRDCQYLRKVTCSPDQVEILKELLDTEIKLIVIDKKS